MMTPFPYEIIASKEMFYGRDDEIKEMLSHIKYSTNILLFSKRRMGKSTLIQNVLNSLSDEYIGIYIDIYNIITAQDFGSLLLNGITASSKGDVLKSIKKLSKIFKRVSVEPTFDVSTGKMGIKPSVSHLSFEDQLEDAFNALFELSKTKKVVLAIDEFQQITSIKDKKIDASLRKYMQEAHNISYIFAGSKRNLLNSLFEYKSPLYAMATPISLGALKLQDIYNYSKQYLNITKDIVEYLYEKADKETKLIQMILHRLYIDKKRFSIIDKDSIDIIMNEILLSKNDHYKALFEILSTNQKKAFKILSKHGEGLYSNDILYAENISRASMQSSLKQLYAKEFIDKDDNKYFIPDRAFELWAIKYLYF
ncbi:MAG: ATP-binding protein [Sulfurimonas sp.]|nr:ATP-binding protein [Sulfurimonas sp.]